MSEEVHTGRPAAAAQNDALWNKAIQVRQMQLCVLAKGGELNACDKKYECLTIISDPLDKPSTDSFEFDAIPMQAMRQDVQEAGQLGCSHASARWNQAV